jgi:cytochrome c oxidase subunit II
MRHFVIVGLLIVILTPLTYFGFTATSQVVQLGNLFSMHTAQLMPIEASAQSLIIDQMWDWDMMVIAFLLCLIMVPLLYSLIVFHRRKGETGEGVHMEGNQTLEITWTIIPLVLVLVFAYLGAYTLGEVQAVDPGALEINVVARQWQWSFNYPDGFTSTELHLPVNRQVVLNMMSLDVIHSFWVPEFRVKQDVLPGRTTYYRITPILLGQWKVRCAELCGTSHSYMEAPVIVQSEADYLAWVKDQAAKQAALIAAGGPDAGKVYVQKEGCGGCHSIDGSRGVGPTWQGLYQSQVKLSDGTTVTADEAYLTQSIVDPGAKIVATFPDGVMPTTFGTVLTQDQIKDIVQYIETLK